jgi:hypothetical protein
MKLKPILAGAMLVSAAAGALAANQSINLSQTGSNANGNTYSGSFAALAAAGGSLVGNPQVFNADNILSGGNDVITFVGAAAGLYNVVLQGSASFVSALAGTLNGQALTVTSSPDGIFHLFTMITTLSPDFTLSLNGVANPFSTLTLNSQYAGNISVTAIPEPETYALLLAGLGVIGFLARRRRPQ